MVQQRIGLTPNRIMISATHAHTTPVIPTNPSRYNLEARNKEVAHTDTNPLASKIADAAVEANTTLQPVEMCAGVGEETTLGFNGRFLRKSGTVGWNPSKLNPNIAYDEDNDEPTAALLPQGIGEKLLASTLDPLLKLGRKNGKGK